MDAKIVAINELTPGSILADNVISLNGKVLLSKDVVLTAKSISLLNIWEVKSVFIKDNEAKPVAEPVPEIIRDNSEDYRQFVQEFNSVVTNTAQAFELIRKRSIVPVPLLKNTAGNIHNTITNNASVMSYLLVGDYKLADYVSRHSIMVAFFAGIIARQMKWNEDDIKGVVLSGLLHDLGNLVAEKVDNPRNQAHIPHAAGLLKNIKGLSGDVILGVVQHRDYVDVGKASTGVNSLKVHPYANIIAVADIFHAQAYTEQYANPFPVLNLLAHEMFGKLDPSVCHSFLSRVRDSLLHNKILLTTGQEAEVIYFHPNGSSLPVIKTADNQIIDLAQAGGVAVSRIIPPGLPANIEAQP